MTSLLMLMRPFVGPLAIAGLFGVLASVTTVALLATTNAMLTGADLKTGTLPVFALLCLLAFGGTALADVVTNSRGAEAGRRPAPLPVGKDRRRADRRAGALPDASPDAGADRRRRRRQRPRLPLRAAGDCRRGHRRLRRLSCLAVTAARPRRVQPARHRLGRGLCSPHPRHLRLPAGAREREQPAQILPDADRRHANAADRDLRPSMRCATASAVSTHCRPIPMACWCAPAVSRGT